MTSISTQPPTIISSSNLTRLRLHYLDGLRGMAALYVVTHHAYAEVTWKSKGLNLPLYLRATTGWLEFGHLAVVVFIALSGYCLMLPIARSADRGLEGGLVHFFSRRAKRILPPYYAAVALSLLLIWLVPTLRQPSNAQWDISLPAWTTGNLLSHLFLVQNVSENWAYKIDYPLWSVATEWQIYFIFALILLPIWRRWGPAAMVAAGFGTWAFIHSIFHSKLDGACFHFIGVFALGMAAAVLNFPRSGREIGWSNRISWGLAASSLFAVCILGLAIIPNWLPRHTSQVDTLAGLGTACFLVYCTRCLSHERPHRPAVLRFLESTFVVRLGNFSYSLYLIHAPVLAIIYAFLRSEKESPSITLVLLIGLGVPIAVSISYLFFLAFERPFLERKNQIAPKAVKISNFSDGADIFGTGKL